MQSPVVNIEEATIKEGLPRVLELALVMAGLALVSPLILIAMVAIRVTSSGPAIFRQQRFGKGGRLFVLYKLRTMHRAGAGPQVTSGDDNRITRVGRILRKTKVDELPELWNIIMGDMSLVGPRPEVPRYVDLTDPAWNRALRAKPGITDPVTLGLRNEESLLASVEGDREKFYREVLLPLKLEGYIKYLHRRNWWSDLRVLYLTLMVVIRPQRAPAPNVEEVAVRLSD